MSTSQIPIGSIGTIPITLPVITIGSGNPRLVFITGLHGGEESGIFILSQLIPRIKPGTGTIVILPSGNPLTQAFKTRFAPFDGQNPNRAFPGNADSDLSRRIAAATIEVIGQADFVVDLHCFSQDCAFTGIIVPAGEPLDTAARQALAIIKPDIIWQEDGGTPDGLPSRINLTGALAERGIPSIALEMPRADHLPPAMAERIVTSLMRLINRSGELDEPISNAIPTIRRVDVRTDQAGFFEPLTAPLQAVTVGQTLGNLIRLETLVPQPIVSRQAGSLFLISRSGIVSTGDKLYAIGVPV